MRPIKIAVCMKDPGYSRAIARGLAEKGLKMEMRVLENLPLKQVCEQILKDWILVTDLNRKTVLDAVLGLQEGVQEDGQGEVLTGVVFLEDDAVSAEWLSRKILLCAQNLGLGGNRGRGLKEENAARALTAGFYADWGGCGVTSAALVTGWLLSGAYGERVLYLPFTGEDGSRQYCPEGSGASVYPTRGSAEDDGPGARELLYRIKHNLPWVPEAYAVSDDCGLDRLRNVKLLTKEEREELAGYLGVKAGYDWILLDFGKEISESKLNPDWKVKLDSFADLRCRMPYDDGRTASVNRSEAKQFISVRNRMEGWHDAGTQEREHIEEKGERIRNRIVIPEDRESFVRDEKNGLISINLHKTFAMGAKKIAEILMKDGAEFSEDGRMPSKGVELRRLMTGHDEL